jgi:predicted transcriptional regulator
METARKRSRTEIVADILKIIAEKGGRIKPTHLMYKANLSHKQMNLYLGELEKGGLTTKATENKKTLLEITKKGREFLSKYIQVREFERTFGL